MNKLNKPLNALFVAAALAVSGVALTGCAVSDDQSSVGQYVDDATITARVKARMAEDKSVSATRISVETLNGTVQLSGFATSLAEKEKAGALARDVSHVKDVRNNIVVQAPTN